MISNNKAYNGVLNACAHPSSSGGGIINNPKNAKEIFRIVLTVLNELRESGLADTTSYGYVFRSCARLLPPHRRTKRDCAAEILFKQACRDGQVGRFVLSEFLAVASPELVARLLLMTTDDGAIVGRDNNTSSLSSSALLSANGGLKIPPQWSQNVSNKRQLLLKKEE
jgi:hypothetical protein